MNFVHICGCNQFVRVISVYLNKYGNNKRFERKQRKVSCGEGCGIFSVAPRCEEYTCFSTRRFLRFVVLYAFCTFLYSTSYELDPMLWGSRQGAKNPRAFQEVNCTFLCSLCILYLLYSRQVGLTPILMWLTTCPCFPREMRCPAACARCVGSTPGCTPPTNQSSCAAIVSHPAIYPLLLSLFFFWIDLSLKKRERVERVTYPSRGTLFLCGPGAQCVGCVSPLGEAFLSLQAMRIFPRC